jgi:hypothetical protein
MAVVDAHKPKNMLATLAWLENRTYSVIASTPNSMETTNGMGIESITGPKLVFGYIEWAELRITQ